MATTNTASSIVTQPVGNQGAPTIVQKAFFALKKTFFTSADLQSPDRLYQVIRQLDDGLSTTLRAVATNPLGNGVLQRGVVIGSPTFTVNLQHMLGRAFVGVICTAAYSNPWLGIIGPQPMGTTPAQVIQLVNAGNPGTFDFWIF